MNRDFWFGVGLILVVPIAIIAWGIIKVSESVVQAAALYLKLWYIFRWGRKT